MRVVSLQIGSQERGKNVGLYWRGFLSALFCVQLFLFLNDLAGRWPLLDEAARLFYIGALPVLGTLVGAQLLLLPRPFGGASRSKTALALVLALVLGALLVWGLGLLASAWHLGNVSPRPWMTRRINWMVVEPQDNSFPCLEVLFAFALSTASLFLNHKIGFLSMVIALLLGITRLFCGNNYFADVAIGALLGIGLFLLCAALVRRHVSLGSRMRGLAVGSFMVGGTLVLVYAFALSTPRFAGKLGFSPARAAPAANVSNTPAVRGVPTLFGEGDESAAPEGGGRAEQVALAKRSSLFLPDVEAFLRGKLTHLARPLTLLDVEVAPVKAGTTSFRCAAVRFEVKGALPDARRIVADRAGRLTRATFALDSHMQNVDIICVERDGGRNLDASMMMFPGDEVPVFTASVQRKNVVLRAPAWLNAPSLDGGSWLRARSRLYINDRALPVNSSLPATAVQPLAPQSASATNRASTSNRSTKGTTATGTEGVATSNRQATGAASRPTPTSPAPATRVMAPSSSANAQSARVQSAPRALQNARRSPGLSAPSQASVSSTSNFSGGTAPRPMAPRDGRSTAVLRSSAHTPPRVGVQPKAGRGLSASARVSP